MSRYFMIIFGVRVKKFITIPYMLMMEEQTGIIRSQDVLDMDFVPSRVVERDGQIKAVMSNLQPLIEAGNPRKSFLYGPPGTGKTCTARFLLEELSGHASLFKSYINCWKTATRFNILYEISQHTGLGASVHRKGTPVDEIISALEKTLKEKPCIVILDEVDQIEEDKVLYDLLSIPGIVLIMISNNPHAFHRTDPRVLSRLTSMDNVEFPTYTPEEISSILSDRVEWGLFPGVIKPQQIQRIARSSSGDARKALEILRLSGEQSDKQGLSSIPDPIINSLLSKQVETKSEHRKSILNPHQKLILDILEQTPGLNSTVLFEQFTSLSKKQGLEPMVDRTFRKYLSTLLRLELIKMDKVSREHKYSTTF
jgi:orc1/cdc6 family replication initiation protein